MANNEPDYKLEKRKEYVNGETRAVNSKYADPLVLFFKLMIHYDKPTGLFADESKIDSALAYLKRIGQTERYEMLKRWIEMFKIFIRDYDFLILQVEGLDLIQNLVPGWQIDQEKVSFTVRETSDMFFQSLLTTYRHIWFDDIRSVEVLPINLRFFDCSVLVYTAGYYNMELYDGGNNTTDVEKLIFPTLRKLSDSEFSMKTAETFNHHLYTMGNCTINNEDSGKPFSASILNEQSSDFIKNNLTLNFRFAHYKGRFNNIMGYVDFVGILAMISAQNRVLNSTQTSNKKSLLGNILSSSKAAAISEAQNIKSSVKQTIKTRIDGLPDKLLSPNAVVGNFLSKLTFANAGNLIKNTIDLGINYVEDKFINDPITKINNLLFQNFSNNIYDLYKNNFGDNKSNKNIALEENNSAFDSTALPAYNQQSIGNIEKGVTFGESNIYNRRTF